MNKKQKPEVFRFGLLLLLVLGGLLVWVYQPRVALPFVLAAFISYIIAPPVRILTSRKWMGFYLNRGSAILLIYSALVSLLTLSAIFFLPKLAAEANLVVRDLPKFWSTAEKDWIEPFEEKFNRWTIQFDPLEASPLLSQAEEGGHEKRPQGATGAIEPEVGRKEADAQAIPIFDQYTFELQVLDEDHYELIPKRKLTAGQAEALKRKSGLFGKIRHNLEKNITEVALAFKSHLVSVVGFVFSTFLTLMIAAFILMDPASIREFFLSLVPPRYHGSFKEWGVEIDKGLQGVVRGQMTIALVNGLLTMVGLIALGVPLWVMLSLVATVCSIIPIFGVLISSIPIVILALTVSPATALLAVGWILIIHFIEGNLLNPKILGDAAAIHPVLVVFALIFGESVGGMTGALLAVPVFSILQSTFKYLMLEASRREERV